MGSVKSEETGRTAVPPAEPAIEKRSDEIVRVPSLGDVSGRFDAGTTAAGGSVGTRSNSHAGAKRSPGIGANGGRGIPHAKEGEDTLVGQAPYVTAVGNGDHAEGHAKGGRFLGDFTLGFSDGITVPFALTAGLSSIGSSKLVIVGGLAEVFSGAISMGVSAYMAARDEQDRYESELQRERHEVIHQPDDERREIFDILAQYHISQVAAAPLVEELSRNPEQWVNFMMEFELHLQKPEVQSAWLSGLVMGAAYLLGGLLPMIPYFALQDNAMHALFVSIGVTAVILVIFGFVKAWLNVQKIEKGWVGAVRTLVIGVIAAGTSYGIVRGFNSRWQLSGDSA